MKRKLSVLSQRYATALETHLKQGARDGAAPARALGRRAAELGLETLDMARIHERAIARLGGAGSKNGFLKNADLFFMKTIAPIEETHQAAMKASARWTRLNGMLDRRTVELAESNRSLKGGTAGRKAVEVALEKSGQHYQALVKKSLGLQKALQRVTHGILDRKSVV